MRISHSLEEYARAARHDSRQGSHQGSRLGPHQGLRHAVTIGNFDGVHLGHRELIRVTREKAAGNGSPSVLVTFDPHPVHVVRGVGKPELITPLPRKLELLEKTGIDHVLVLPFTASMAAMDAESFVRLVLVDALAVSDLVTGYNFALGRGRSGNLSTLRGLAEAYGFTVTQVQPVVVNGETVSSSLVRGHIKTGELARATALLGRPHSVDGEVVHGQARGRKLGFPTANIAFPDMILPPLGAYAAWLRLLPDEKPRMSMTSVGTNPTFGGGSVTLEAHVLDFSGDLYGRTARLYFMKRLRGEITFQGPEALVQRLTQDADAARDALRRNLLDEASGVLGL